MMKLNRSKRLILNTSSSFAMQAVTAVCGLIVPRLILRTYGSDVNGLVHSIAQFLSVISFLELGIGAVIQSALYKPLAENDNKSVSRIIRSGSNFFKKLALLFTGYVAALIWIYPLFVKSDFDKVFTIALLLILSIGFFAQYYFGLIDMLLLNSAQYGFVHYTMNIVLTVIGTVISWFLIRYGFSIHIVKLSSALIFLLKPVLIRIFVNKKFCIDRKIELDGEPISQKWNGVAQHTAAVVLDGTDNIVLTLFSTLANVSVYSTYHMIVFGIKNLLLSASGGIQSLLGELIATDDREGINKFFSMVEFAVHTCTVLLFSCVGILIVPFISIYTSGINDANYIQPLFAVLITCAHACHCLRLPYNIAILAGGHYKQTQSNYIIAAIINIIISVVTVKFLGLIGVAIGTLAAMIYQTIWMAVYDSKNIIEWPVKNFIKRIFVDLLIAVSIVISTCWIKLDSLSYFNWAVIGAETTMISLVITVFISFVFYKNVLIEIINRIKLAIKGT